MTKRKPKPRQWRRWTVIRKDGLPIGAVSGRKKDLMTYAQHYGLELIRVIITEVKP